MVWYGLFSNFSIYFHISFVWSLRPAFRVILVSWEHVCNYFLGRGGGGLKPKTQQDVRGIEKDTTPLRADHDKRSRQRLKIHYSKGLMNGKTKMRTTQYWVRPGMSPNQTNKQNLLDLSNLIGVKKWMMKRKKFKSEGKKNNWYIFYSTYKWILLLLLLRQILRHN